MHAVRPALSDPIRTINVSSDFTWTVGQGEITNVCKGVVVFSEIRTAQMNPASTLASSDRKLLNHSRGCSTPHFWAHARKIPS